MPRFVGVGDRNEPGLPQVTGNSQSRSVVAPNCLTRAAASSMLKAVPCRGSAVSSLFFRHRFLWEEYAPPDSSSRLTGS